MARLFVLLVILNAAFFFWQFNANEPAVRSVAGAVPVADNIPMLVLLGEAGGTAKPLPANSGGGQALNQDGSGE